MSILDREFARHGYFLKLSAVGVVFACFTNL